MTNQEILDKVNEMLKTVTPENTNNRISLSDIEDKICLRESVKNILKESKNEKLNSYLNNVLTDLANGKTESMIYESFISAVSNWNYLSAVDTELSALANRVEKYKQEIDLSKILNTMKQTSSAYIVPVIEECVVDYINDKTSNNRVILTDRLMAFQYDPFVKDLLEAIHCDRSIYESFKYNTEKNNNVTIEKVYSPVYSVSESECIFNINGSYYSKKGNNISRLSKSNVTELNENFINLCNTLNSKYIRINENDNIEVAYGDKVAEISENVISINGAPVTISIINEARGESYLANDGYVNFYNTVEYLAENYNSIACIDFAKHVKSTTSKNSFDYFKLKESYYLTTHDEVGNHTFYRNINPIQTVNIMNEHMNLNISDMFEELQPNQKKIKHEIDETKKSYEDYIAELEERKVKLNSCQEGLSDEDAADVKEALKIVEDELEKVKNDYKEYQKTSDDFLNAKSDDTEFDYSDELDNFADDSVEDVDSEDNSDDANNNIDDNIDNVDMPLTDETEVREFDPLFDETPVNEPEDEYSPKVVKVSYKSNIKTGQISNLGEVHILIPSVNANGDVTNELQKITFTLDAERNPIINNDYMPVAIYNIIKDAIENEPMTSNVDVNGTAEVPSDVLTIGDDVAITDDVVDENPIDQIYGTENLPTENPEMEPEDVRDLISTDDEQNIDDEDLEPEVTESNDVEVLNDAVDENGVFAVNVSFDDLLDQDIDITNFENYLRRNNIKFADDNKSLTITIRYADDCNLMCRYFVEYLGWSRPEFFTFFDELRVYESYKPSKVVVKYSSELESILESNNLDYKLSKRGDKMMIMNAVNEGVLITVTDDKTGKTIKINTDELNDNTESEEHDENTQDDVTFNDNEDVNSTDDNSTAETEDNAEEKNESVETKVPEKKFTFRIKKRKTDESLGLTEYTNKLNEMHESPEVMDVIKYKGKNGHVISKLSNGELIVEVGGHTEMIRPSQVKIVNTDFVRNDDLNESVSCGIFMNGMRITPLDCVTDKQKFECASDDDMITVIVEGVSQNIAKKYTKILS